jgi:hypothetical protein
MGLPPSRPASAPQAGHVTRHSVESDEPHQGKIEILMYRPIPLLALILAAGLAAGCGDDDNPTAPTPIAPNPIFDTFEGTLTPNGGVTNTFVVQRAGEVSALIALTPAEAVVGLSLGPMSTQACSAAIARDNAMNATSILGAASTAGNFCVRVYDAGGTLTGPVAFTITVQHF